MVIPIHWIAWCWIKSLRILILRPNMTWLLLRGWIWYLSQKNVEKFFLEYHINLKLIIKGKKTSSVPYLHYFCNSMAKDVKGFVDKCNICLKMSPLTSFMPLKPVEVSYPFKLVSLDTAHITMPSGNKEYIVVEIDYFTCLIEEAILTNKTI